MVYHHTTPSIPSIKIYFRKLLVHISYVLTLFLILVSLIMFIIYHVPVHRRQSRNLPHSRTTENSKELSVTTCTRILFMPIEAFDWLTRNLKNMQQSRTTKLKMGSKKEEVDKLVDVLHKTIAGDEKRATNKKSSFKELKQQHEDDQVKLKLQLEAWHKTGVAWTEYLWLQRIYSRRNISCSRESGRIF